MKCNQVILIATFLAMTYGAILAQSTDQFLETYRTFLSTHEDMTTEQLMDMHPAGMFNAEAPVDWESALYHDSIEIKFGLTDDEKALIKQQGFVVTERLRKPSFHEQFADIWHKDLPVFLSVDAILHAFHASYNQILIDVEVGYLIPQLQQLLQEIHQTLPTIEARYKDQRDMHTMLKDVDVYVTVARKLFDPNIQPYYTSNQDTVDTLLRFINREQLQKYALFSDHCRTIDFSQFKPRGHYTSETHPELAHYFRAMMWLGRIEFYLIAPRQYEDEQTLKDIQRQIIDACLIEELVEMADVRSAYEQIEQVLTFFVGEQDNVTLNHLSSLRETLDITEADQLLDTSRVKQLQDTLSIRDYAFQRILSHILMSDPMSPEQIRPASSFMLFGQRFVIDSYVTGSVVFDNILYEKKKVCRLFPSTLDVLFALGNDAAAQLLREELEQYHYAPNLAALRYLIDSYPSGFWQGTLYNQWLNVIRTLNPEPGRETLPAFMQTAAWWQQKMNSQLASWTELRHDNLLYAKQSYTGGIICSFPYVFVEPNPEFFETFGELARTAKETFASLPIDDEYNKQMIHAYLDHFQSVCEQLATIARKELQQQRLTQDEQTFLKQLIRNSSVCGPPFEGWYSRLFYKESYVDWAEENSLNVDYLVADYHTTPTDCGGAMMGWVMHAGTGGMDMMIAPVSMPDGNTLAFVGPVMSYYEHTTTNFLRLTDEEWQSQYLQQTMRPDWVNLYLTDAAGADRGEGRQLMTAIDNNKDIPNGAIPESFLQLRNYPNPFNAGTVIAITIGSKFAHEPVQLTIYDIEGRMVTRLLDRPLPGGNYLTRWNGVDQNNQPVASGAYFCRVSVAGHSASKRMVLLR